ncbi:hypothetical protein BGLA2_170016 [Burkholderia gladioli]|nr:hypothetical protein BGLA2_170016 [Burkholderia gladioli]
MLNIWEVGNEGESSYAEYFV